MTLKVRRMLPVVTVLFLAGCGLSEVEEAQRDQYKVRGLTYYENAQYEQALDQFEKALAIDPDDYDTLVMLGYTYLLQPKGDMIVPAGDVFLECLDRKSGDYRAHLGYGVTCFLLGVFFELQHQEKSLEALEHRRSSEAEGTLPDEKGRHERLAGELEAAAADCLKKSTAWFPKADEAFVRTHQIEPKNPFVLQMLAFNQIKMGVEHFPQALAHLAEFVRLREVDLAAYRVNLDKFLQLDAVGSADVARFEGWIRDGETDLRKARSMSAWLYVILAHERPAESARYFAAAQDEIEKAVLVDPHHPSPHLNQAKIHHEQYKLAEKAGDKAAMVQALQRASNELFLFQERNQFSAPEYNVMTKDVILWLDTKLKEIQGEPPSGAEGPTPEEAQGSGG